MSEIITKENETKKCTASDTILVEKHGEGSYWEHLPTLSRFGMLEDNTIVETELS